MSLKFTTTSSQRLCGLAFSTVGLCVLFVGCGAESTPVTSKSTKYEVSDTTESADASQAVPPANVADATPSTDQVPPRRPAPINQTPAGDASSPDMVQPTADQLVSVIRRLRQQPYKEGSREDAEPAMSERACNACFLSCA